MFIIAIFSLFESAYGSFFSQAVLIRLFEEKVAKSSLALIMMISYPLNFRFLISPIIDTFFVGFIGKRKTYIIPA